MEISLQKDKHGGAEQPTAIKLLLTQTMSWTCSDLDGEKVSVY